MRNRNNIQIAKIVLAISFIILFGRLIYAAVGSYSHHKNKQQTAIERGATPAVEQSPSQKTP